MSCRIEWRRFVRGAVAAPAVAACLFAFGAEEAAGAKDDEEAEGAEIPPYKEEVDYAEALVDSGFSDFAKIVIDRTKKKWPESETMFFAIEVRSLLAMNKEDQAKARIAALPDRKSAKYWAARLELANFCWRRGRKTDCAKLYGEFFKANAKPAKELRPFVRQAYWQYGQILASGKRLAEAAANYEAMLKMLDKNNDQDLEIWFNVACETAEIYLQLANDAAPGKAREPHLAAARRLVNKLLWASSMPVFFGRAIALKAQIELLSGSVAKAQATIDEYMGQLSDLHKQIEEADPDGRNGLLRQSPMPLCRYMLAEMMWKAALAEAKKDVKKRDHEHIKSLLFGEKGANGKRGKGGAYSHAINVFVRYPQSAWASRAGELAKQIAAFTEKEYNKKIKTNITPEQEARVRSYQFRNATEKFGEGKYDDAIKEFLAALANYPDGKDSVSAAEHVAISHLRQIIRGRQEAKGKELGADAKAQEASRRIDVDAIEGYIVERFSGSSSKAAMTEGGNATLRLAAMEKQLGEKTRAATLYRRFLEYYPKHANAPITAASLASEAMKEKRWRDSAALWTLIDLRYPDSIYRAAALMNKAKCLENLGDMQGAIDSIDKYISAEKNELSSMKARMNLAMLYQRVGRDMVETASTNAAPEAVQAQLNKGAAQIVRGIMQFQRFAQKAEKMLGDEAVSAGDKKEYEDLREKAMYLVGENWSRMTRPEKNIELYRSKAAAALESYVAAYPKGQLAKNAYVKLGMIYTLTGELSKSKSALERLRKQFPESEEAKKAMPRLARSIIEYSKAIEEGDKKTALLKEVTQIYTEMIRGGGDLYQAPDYVRAGENLIEARSWDLADEAFEKAIATAGTNFVTSAARAKIGKAKSLYAQKHYGEAREMLDAFMDDPKTSRSSIATNACELIVAIAMKQGSEERDDTLRMKHYGAALAAAKKLKGYWSKEPLWKQDRATFLMPADVKIAQAEAEVAMGLDEAAAKTRRIAAANLQSYLQARVPEDAGAAPEFTPEERANIEEAYSKFVPLLAKIGADQSARALEAGSKYLQLFPEGEYKEIIQRAMNEASAAGGGAAAKEAPASGAAEAPEAGEKGEAAEQPAAPAPAPDAAA